MHPSQFHAVCHRMQIAGYAFTEIARLLNVSRMTIWRWCNGRSQTSSPRTTGRSTKLTAAMQQECLDWIVNQKSCTQVHVQRHAQDAHHVLVSQSTICRMITRLGVTRKRAVKFFAEQDPEKVQRFLADLPVQATEDWLALDECSFVLNHAPSYGYAKKGARVVVSRPGNRGRRYSLLLCIAPTRVVLSILVPGGIKSPTFQSFMTALPPNVSVVLDNASIHHACNTLKIRALPTVAETAARRNQTLRYLPAYTPQLNPTELCFNYMRTLINQAAPRSEADLKRAIDRALHNLTPSKLDGFFRHCWSTRTVA